MSEVNNLERFIGMLDSAYVPSRYMDGKDMEYRFWFRSLLMDLNSMLVFHNLPESWPQNFFKLNLFARGYVTVFQSQRFGDPEMNNVAFQPCTLGGYDFYYMPEYCIVANPKFQKKLYIGTDCEVLQLNEDYMGIFDLVDYFAQKLANLSIALNMATANAKIPAVFTCATDRERRTIEAAYDDTQSGKPILIIKNPENSEEIMPTKNLVEAVYAELRNSYIGTELLENIRTTLNNWYETIGYAVALDKNSHVLNEEADFQYSQSTTKVKTWTNMLNIGFEKVNKLFGTNMEVEYACENMPSSNAEASDDREQEHK